MLVKTLRGLKERCCIKFEKREVALERLAAAIAVRLESGADGHHRSWVLQQRRVKRALFEDALVERRPGYLLVAGSRYPAHLAEPRAEHETCERDAKIECSNSRERCRDVGGQGNALLKEVEGIVMAEPILEDLDIERGSRIFDDELEDREETVLLR